MSSEAHSDDAFLSVTVDAPNAPLVEDAVADKLLDHTPTKLEKFGATFLDRLASKRPSMPPAVTLTDELLEQRVAHLTHMGLLATAMISFAFVLPPSAVDLFFLLTDSQLPFFVRFAIVNGLNIICVIIEVIVLLHLSLWLSHGVGSVLQLEPLMHVSMLRGPFSVVRALSRTALEIDDPAVNVQGIDPFESLNKRNLLFQSILYKLKIILTNLSIKALFVVVGCCPAVPILMAFPVEIFWNSIVVSSVIYETKLRLCGFALANMIANEVEKEGYLDVLSPLAKRGCLHAIGSVMVMSNTYHMNLVILLLRFSDLLNVEKANKEERYDDWKSFMDILASVNENERNFLHDLVTVAASFDGKFSPQERTKLRECFGEDYPMYSKRITTLVDHLRHGRINAAFALCRLDFLKG